MGGGNRQGALVERSKALLLVWRMNKGEEDDRLRNPNIYTKGEEEVKEWE